jgi:hypothetical protein
MMRRAVHRALRERDLFDRVNPFARSHHTDSISVHSPDGAARHPPSDERYTFKLRVAEFYGLLATDAEQLVDMFGVTRRVKDVTLAHVWPASYTNWGDMVAELAMPVGFHTEPRNFMLLPRDVHEAFDTGNVVFVPSTLGIRCFVRPEAPVSDAVRQLHGRSLHLPLHTSPYKRLLAFFARCATRHVFRSLDPDVRAAFEEASSASEDTAGNAALQSLILRMEEVAFVFPGGEPGAR